MLEDKEGATSPESFTGSVTRTEPLAPAVHPLSTEQRQQVEENDAHFDASHFISTLLGNAPLIDRLLGIQRHKPILFVVPGGGSEEWMRDANTLARNLENICCAADADGQRAITLSGVPVLIAEDTVQVAEEPDDAFSMEGGIPGYDFDVASSKWASLTFRSIPIQSRFSIDSDGIVAKIYVLDTDEGHLCRHEEGSKLENLQTPTSLTGSPRTAPNSNNSSDSLSRMMAIGAKSPSHFLPWRETLLRKLREPEAAPIVKEIKRLIKYLAQEEVPTSSKAEVTQHFYSDLRHLLQSNLAWREASREELDGSMDAIEKYIFGKVNIFVYQAADVDDQLQDKLFYDKTNSLAKLSPADLAAYLGRPSDHEGESGGGDRPTWPTPSENVQSTLSACWEFQSPIEKLDALVGFIKMCALEIDGGAGSADLLLPTIVQLVLKESPRTLISDVRYIQRFRNHARLVGEASYCLTNMIAVITMIEKIYAEQVAKSDPIYSMLASQDDLLLGGAPLTTQARGRTQTSAPATIAPSPSADLNSMASSFINTIGFVPRAIGSAVADTFRSRSSASQTVPKEKSFSTTDTQRRSSLLSIGGDTLLAVPSEIRDLRKKVTTLPHRQIGSITLREIELIIEDYRRLLDHFT